MYCAGGILTWNSNSGLEVAVSAKFLLQFLCRDDFSVDEEDRFLS